ncbi:hypothetical protein [Solimonas marina]|uniref:Uncharacterized protein n=1 Tax=Solimonas marina TaxID=2714601 RepID=A0A970BAC8_9GAMM|nr:hypothetical protein [Solimonas marina]NKF23241.1 hypothetical protein [Solimonas marina]
MQQAFSVPQNTLISDQTADTLVSCVNVLAFLLDAEDTRQEAGDAAAPMSDAAKDGEQWVRMLVMDALRYEATRTAGGG